jgi:hypothetical protein
LYKTRGNTSVGPTLFADDNFDPLSIRSATDIQPIIDLYKKYTMVSGLNINIRKTTTLCINTPLEIVQGLNQIGIETPEVCKHLGIFLGKTIERTTEDTMRNTEAKRIKRILATTPPTDLLHRALIINSALIPIYNHIFMALPTQEDHIKDLQQEIIDFLWTRQEEGAKIQKRRLIAKDRISASFEKGGLHVPHPADTADGLHLNLLPKIYNKIRLPEVYPNSLLPNIPHEILQDAGLPSFQYHLENLGPEKWERRATKIKNRNLLFSPAVQAMAKILGINEKDRKTWHASAINGHTKFNKLLPLTQNEARTFRAHNLITISQLYETNEHGILQNNPNPNVSRLLANEPELTEKLNLLRQAINRLHLPLQDKLHTEVASAGLLLRGESKMSSSYRKMLRNIKDSTIKIAKAYHTRRQDGVYYPRTETFKKAYNIIQLSSLPSKT